MPMVLDKAMTTAIIGYGWVGKAMHKLFPESFTYDPNIIEDQDGVSLCDQIDINKCDIAFICVPTPSINDGNLDIGIVEKCVAWCTCPLLVVRSTVNPGTCGNLARKYKKRIVMQPEYLGETVGHPLFDPTIRKFLIIGGISSDRRELINLYATVYNANITIRQVTTYEAEIIKLTENRAIAYKVSECQELYDVCEMAGVDYYTIRD